MYWQSIRQPTHPLTCSTCVCVWVKGHVTSRHRKFLRAVCKPPPVPSCCVEYAPAALLDWGQGLLNAAGVDFLAFSGGVHEVKEYCQVLNGSLLAVASMYMGFEFFWPSSNSPYIWSNSSSTGLSTYIHTCQFHRLLCYNIS